jgi:hypothetical protein
MILLSVWQSSDALSLILVGTLFDEGVDDENICLAVLKTWEKMKKKSSERITDSLGVVSGMPG